MNLIFVFVFFIGADFVRLVKGRLKRWVFVLRTFVRFQRFVKLYPKCLDRASFLSGRRQKLFQLDIAVSDN